MDSGTRTADDDFPADADFASGRAAFDRGEYELSHRILDRLAEGGDAQAQYLIGLMWRDGLGMAQDYEFAVQAFAGAADQGHMLAQIALADMYLADKVPDGGAARGIALLRSAALQGHDESQYRLAVAYREGVFGLRQDFAKALYWYRASALQGHTLAQGDLAGLHEDGFGTPQDFLEAHMWANLAAAKAFALSPEERDRIYENRKRLTSALTAEQVGQAQRMARDWRPAGEVALTDAPEL